ncbi:hypothetical protein TWF569_001119 [Orbilia oligospora]|uniref:Uncharacterized protein n=2 Tax=Orbilia oligospora TaxID=2813651 RepID=A0A7C8JQE1_ORBOL|nr:hypothetical protein TWF706_003149 [Orbilia oligospora]KAF3124974.1 hypothetical protein TWF569_001119 [Orbilia oligospora]KAF3128426.1 hypothetical protein TWF594_011618 [Orbilia oligospora]KAF3139473.1 hypothetical protein TWF703_003662 [Orbilia oligospora]
MEQQHRQEAAGRRGERELNPFRHVQPKPPANAGTEEFRREMLQMEQRLAPRVSDSRTRALELERELNSGTPVGVPEPEGSSPRTPHPKPTPGPQFPGLRTVILPGPAAEPGPKQRSGLLASDPLDRVDRRLLSPEPASIALPMSPTSADASRFLVLYSPVGEVITPHPAWAGPATTPGLSSGQITPPPRPTPPPTAPRRSTRRAPQEFSRTPAPVRTGIEARGIGLPRTAPPNRPVSYPRTDQSSGQRVEQAGSSTTQQQGSRRITPMYVSPPIGGTAASQFTVDIQSAGGPSTQPVPRPTTQSVFERLSSSSLTQKSGISTALATPRDLQSPGRPEPPTAMPLSFLPPEHVTSFPGLRVGHNVRDTLRKVSAETPKGGSERSTPADSTVIRKNPITSRPGQLQQEEASGSKLGSSAGLSSLYRDLRELQDDSPLVGKSIKAASARERTKGIASKSLTLTTKAGTGSQELLQLDSSPKAPESTANPQALHPGNMNSARDPRGYTSAGGILDETLDSLESLCGTIKRIESTMKDYRKNLEVDAQELKRDQKFLPHLQDRNTQDGSARSQHYHSDRVESLLQDFRKKESRYQKSLESLNRLDEDPLLDPTFSIPIMDGENETKQRIIFRGRLHIRDVLKKLGYRGGPVRSFLERLDKGIWKLELSKAIIATDPGISEGIQILNELGHRPERGSEIDFNGIDLNDLSSLPWGNFRLKRLGDTIIRDKTGEVDHLRRKDKGKGKATIQDEKETATPEASAAQPSGRTPTPTIPDSDSEAEADYEKTFMTDPGMTPRLKSRLSLLEQREKSEKSSKDGSRPFHRR